MYAQRIHLKEIASTNNYMIELIQSRVVEEGFVIHADFQFKGKGQSGNYWESEHGKNLLFSIVLYPKNIASNEQFIISQFTSLAIKKVLDMYATDISIKWPNDIYWKDKKIAGILIENSLIGDAIDYSVIGIGLNLNQTVFESNAPNPISLKAITGRTYLVEQILDDVLEQICHFYKSPSEIIRDMYKQSLYRRNGLHRYSDQADSFLAQIIDVRDNGMLVLRDQNGLVRSYSFKQIQYTY